jgi:hypothetical protein
MVVITSFSSVGGLNVSHLFIVRAFVGTCGIFLLTSLLLHHAMQQQMDDGRNVSFWFRKYNNNRTTIALRNEPKSHGSKRSEDAKDRRTDTNISMRLLFEMDHPPDDWVRIQAHVAKQRRFPMFSTPDNMVYDIYHCPEEPPPSYPIAWNVINVMQNWNPDDVEEKDWPPLLYQGLCVFDWNNDRQKAETYRRAELPFVIQNHPDLLRASERWTTPGYLSELIGGSLPESAEHSRDNHFMFWRIMKRFDQKNYTPPTSKVTMAYDEWLTKATSLQTQPNQAAQEHWYFRLNAVYTSQGTLQNLPEAHTYLYDELPIFIPNKKDFFMVDPAEQRGINCRFGMKGIVSEAHHDASRNFVVLLSGQRRYVLAHPNQCPNMELYPLNHPSGRQSSVDWSTRFTDPKTLEQFRLVHPKFCDAQVNEVVLQAGDALYLPTFWFHYIVSLNVNYQCNARSGTTFEHVQVMRSCGQ